MRRFLFTVVAAGLAAAALAPTAAAVEPIKEDISFSNTGVLTDVCSFPVTVEATNTGTQTSFSDHEGNLTRVQIHNVEQDVFSANGRTLVGLPYTFNIQVLFDPDSGDPTHIYASGLASRVPLPGGDFFLTAGRIDFAAHPDATFVIQPDVGAQGNLAGFCAALSP
jgi:hypothetical protein